MSIWLNEINYCESFGAKSVFLAVLLSSCAGLKADNKITNDQLIKMNSQFANKDTSSARTRGMIKTRKASIAKKACLPIFLVILSAYITGITLQYRYKKFILSISVIEQPSLCFPIKKGKQMLPYKITSERLTNARCCTNYKTNLVEN